MARTNVSTCLCIQANRLKHVCTFLIGYRSGGMPYILRNLRRVPDCGPLSEEAVPASAPATSRLFVLTVATRRWVLTDNTRSPRRREIPPTRLFTNSRVSGSTVGGKDYGYPNLVQWSGIKLTKE